MAFPTLQAIRTKVRRLTRSPSPQQITNDTIDEYVNTFLLYDLPEHLRVFTLRSTLKFPTQPFVDVYDTNTVNLNDPLYDFKNSYITTHKPVYIAGNQTLFSQSREQFFNIYPLNNSITSIGSTGDGVTTAYSGTLSSIPILQSNVMFESIDADSEGIALVDIPQIDGVSGHPTQTGDLVVPDTTTSVGTINYVTGVYTFTFPAAPGSGEAINSQTIPYQAARPQSILFYDNKFTVRPVPDRVYTVEMEVYKQPTELFEDLDQVELDQWWQYIAYGAAKKVFEDRLDVESVQLIMPEFKQQERLVLRRTIVQQTKERSSTIYTNQTDLNSGHGGFNGL